MLAPGVTGVVWLMEHAGSFSRSAVMNDTGAKTGLAGVVMGLLVCSTLLFLTPLFADIPQVSTIFIFMCSTCDIVDQPGCVHLN